MDTHPKYCTLLSKNIDLLGMRKKIPFSSKKNTRFIRYFVRDLHSRATKPRLIFANDLFGIRGDSKFFF